MAEIKIVKKSTPIWPWILLAVAIIALLIYLFTSRDEGDDRDDMAEATTEDTSYASSSPNSGNLESTNSEAIAFVSFIREDPDQMGINHEYTNEALTKLISATNAMSTKVGYNAQQDLTQVRTHAQKITADPFETTHANSIRDAAAILAQTLQNIQQHAFSDLSSDADEVKKAAAAIKADVLTLDQKGEVKNFFRESADLLEKMNNHSTNL